MAIIVMIFITTTTPITLTYDVGPHRVLDRAVLDRLEVVEVEEEDDPHHRRR